MDNGLRAKWVPRLAKAIGWTPPRLRYFMKKNGIEVPFNEARALQALAENKISTKRYKPTSEPAASTESPAKVNGMVPAQSAVASSGTAAIVPLTGWDRQLIRRLARLLPEGPTKDGKKRARSILKKHGYKGPRWKDEPRALAIFEAEGISTADFQHLDTSSARSASARSAPSVSPVQPAAPVPATYEDLLVRYNELSERHKKALEGIESNEQVIRSLYGASKLATEMLTQYEHQILKALGSGEFGGRMLPPLGFPIDALNEFRKRK